MATATTTEQVIPKYIPVLDQDVSTANTLVF